MAFCDNCGTQLEEGAKFCPSCGTKVELSAPAQAALKPIAEKAAAPVPNPTPAAGWAPSEAKTIAALEAERKKEEARERAAEEKKAARETAEEKERAETSRRRAKESRRKVFLTVTIIFALYFVLYGVLPRLRKRPGAESIPIEALLDRSGETIRSALPVNALTKNGAGKIFRVSYGDDYTVIGIMRTTGEHREIILAEPKNANAFYVEDLESKEKYPLLALRKFDEGAAGVDLIFRRFDSRNFNLIEGADTSDAAWHFMNVKIAD